jgi:hypothetical protein
MDCTLNVPGMIGRASARRLPDPPLENATRATGRSKNAIVREAVERYLQREGAGAAGTFGEVADSAETNWAWTRRAGFRRYRATSG